ncbi:hypothetical protein [Streptomyces brasiliensis]|uniref:hypothetical protein n=1 Tax=Streptomyces brasiliensis TaxID=1954 RepID=UPI001E48F1F8|nr:hypothetical protein [Streptomyces brasiliensis]
MGENGIARAVFVDAGGDDMERMGPTIPGSWGEVQLQDRDGALIGWFDIEDWLPESPALVKRSVQGEQALRRTGAADLFRSAGVPVHIVRDRNDPRVAPRTRAGRGTALGPGKSFPAWYWNTRAVAGGVWFATITVIILSGSTAPWLVLLSAVAALVAPTARLALRAWTRRRLKRCAPVVRERVKPAPADELGATVRFCRDTELRVQDSDLVLRELGGQEYWFPLTGPHALTALVLVRDRTGAPLGAELRGPGDQVRVVLPWGPWFAGEGGTDGWSRLRRSAGLSVSERSLTGKGTWPKPALGSRPLPQSGREARAMSRFPGTVAGASSTAVMAVGSFFSLTLGARIEDSHPGAGGAAILMGALGAVLQALPYGIHQLRSRLWLDRPVTPAGRQPLTERTA